MRCSVQDYLRQHLDRSLEESSSLKSLLFSMKKDVKTADAPSALNLQISGELAALAVCASPCHWAQAGGSCECVWVGMRRACPLTPGGCRTLPGAPRSWPRPHPGRCCFPLSPLLGSVLPVLQACPWDLGVGVRPTLGLVRHRRVPWGLQPEHLLRSGLPEARRANASQV